MSFNKAALAERFAALSPNKQVEFLDLLRKQGMNFALLPIVPHGARRRGVLSYAQQRQWFLWRLNPESTAYHITGALRLQGRLDVEALRASFAALVARHAALRTVFRGRGDGLAKAEFQPELKLDISLIDVAQVAAAEREVQAQEVVQQINAAPFDLTCGPLLRVALIRVANEDHILVVVMHHIISDGWSLQILVDELAALYRARLQGRSAQLAPLPIQYSDYAMWQRNWLEAGEKEKQLTYWRAQLGDDHPVLQLPADHPRTADGNYRAATFNFTLPAALTAALQRWAHGQGATLFMALLAGFQVLLHRYTGQEDIRVGVPIANRHRPETQGVVGFFVNTQVLRNRVSGRMPLATVLSQAREAALGAQAHQDLPFEQLVEALQPERSLSHSPLFQVMYNHLRHDGQPLARLPGLTLSDYPLGEQGAQFELSLDTTEGSDGQVRATLSYAAELFERGTIERFAAHYLKILSTMAEYPERLVGEAELLSGAEQRQLQLWGVNETRYRAAEPVHRLFERQVEQRPAATALIFEDTELSYAELNRRVNRLAHRLLALGIAPEAKVGVALERSVEMVVGVLAVLKAGAAYVPLDPEYPPARLAYLVEDSGLEWVLTQSYLQTPLSLSEEVKILALDRLALETEPEHNPAVELHGENLAYVIYTSGSTGRPKGVSISHRVLVEHTQISVGFFGLTPVDRMLQFATLNFDGHIEQVFPPLTVGAAIVLRGPALWDSAVFYHELLDKRISVADLTTAYWHLLVQDFARQQIKEYGVLRQVHAGGEAMPPAALEIWRKTGLGSVKLLNTYGPTEAAVTASVLDCAPYLTGELPLPQQMSIGGPLAGRTLRVLDSELNLLPPGVAGELCIGGALLARGYLNRPGLTAERFVADPFDSNGSRLYRTGDLVRWRADGQLEYLGRIDHQVKIRGFRIELGEIETQLLLQPEVKEATVVAKDGPGGSRLVAYVAPSFGQQIDIATLRGHLTRALPDYMIPSVFMALPALPLSPNGKVDRQALPEPELTCDKAYEPPQGEAEELLARIWAEVLELERIGRNDNFFELGGDSILSLQIVARVRGAGWKIAPKHVFERQTVAELAKVAEAIQETMNFGQSTAHGEVPLLPIQADFFALGVPAPHHWNQAVLLQSHQPLSAHSLAKALEALVRHHDALRLRYVQDADGQWRQRYSEATAQALLWVREAADAEAIEALCEAAQRSLDLAAGPLLRALLIHVADGSTRLLLVIHHLVVDGVSWRIVLEDLQTAYTQAQAGSAITLPDKTSSYQAWAKRLQSYGIEHEDELAYWQALARVPAALPCDDPQGRNTARYQANVRFKLSRAKTQALLKEAPAAYRTQVNDLLLTALGRALCAWSGQDKILIDLEGHGREDLFAELDFSRTVGWFTTLFPVVLDPLGERGEALKRVKESLRRIPRRGLGYGVFKYLGSAGQQQALEAVPKAEVVFNYLGQFDSSFDNRALWNPAKESSGAATAEAAPLSHAFVINGEVYGGELALTVSYSTARYRQATVQDWVQRFRQELEELIDHCREGVLGVTPSDFPLARLMQAQLDRLPVPLEQLEDLYPLSPMQAGMLFHSVYERGGHAYLNQLRVDIEGLEVARFRQAWQGALARHSVLRTGFLTTGENPVQWVARQVTVPLAEHDWRDRAELAPALEALAQAELAQGFDLAHPPLMRLVLVRTGVRRHHFIWTNHHLLLDGWSTSQLLGEVLREYSGMRLAAPPARYREYIAWLQAREGQASEAYWREQLGRLAEPTRLAQALPRPVAGEGYGEQVAALDAEATRRLVAFAKGERVTVNTLVQAAWALLLQRYTGQGAVVFGATVAGRPGELAGAEQMLGLFINTLPVVAAPHPAQRVGDWLRELQAQNLAAREHEHTPLYQIQRWAGHGGQPLFDSLLVFENFPLDAALAAQGDSGLKFGRTEVVDVTTYPMDVEVHFSEVLSIKFIYQRQYFRGDSILALQQHLFHLLEAIPRNGAQGVGELTLLTPEEQRMIFSLGRSGKSYPLRIPVHQRIELHARAKPQAIALLMGQQKMNYGELNRQANRLAHRLIAAGIGPEARVGVAMERSLDLVIALLAVLKAGAAYVPLDPVYPANRLAFMMEDSGLSLLLTQRSLLTKLRLPSGVEPLALDEMELAAEPDINPEVAISEQNLAYVIYTSGSTGTPKGVAVAHGPLTMHCQATAEIYGMGPHWCELLFMSFSFDGAHERWLTALTTGASLAIRDNELWTAEQTYTALHRYQISNAAFPPAYLGQLADWAASRNDPPPLELYVFGGEAMPKAAYEQVRQTLRPRLLINGYGPTETVVTPLIWKTPATKSFDGVYAPIGKPVGERTAYVLDEEMQPVPLGVVGELYIGGYGLARGYLGRPGLTAERFVADPFAAKGGRLYRTGDLVRWLDNGNVEYVGRADQQVKIRGFRVELGEIEARMREVDGVSEAAAAVHESGAGRQLVAYVVPAVIEQSSQLATRLKQALGECLPDYMVPAQIVTLPSLPRLPSGKLDRSALPEPGSAAERTYVPPSTPAAKQLAAIWQEVLGVEQVGETDNFFELGGDSLLSLKVMTRLRQLGDPQLHFQLRDLMQRPTLAGLLGLNKQSHGTVHMPLALNQASNEAEPLFCFHAGMGTVFDYQPLAHRLQGRRTVYGLPCRMLTDPAHCDTSLEQMARDYRQLIRQVQPQGPYHLLGWSLGGALAALVAGLLEAEGQTVAFLGLVDSFIPGDNPPHQEDWRRDLTDFVSVVIPGAALEEKFMESLGCASPSAQTVAGLLERAASTALNALPFAQGYAMLNSEDLARVFMVARHLQMLSRRLSRLPALQVSANCWWIKGRALAERRALVQQLGQEREAVELAADHAGIVRAEAFLKGVDHALAALPKGDSEGWRAGKVSAA